MSDSLFLLNLKLNTKSYNYKSDFKLNWDNKSVRKIREIGKEILFF